VLRGMGERAAARMDAMLAKASVSKKLAESSPAPV
jgi:hypothetical protein